MGDREDADEQRWIRDLPDRDDSRRRTDNTKLARLVRQFERLAATLGVDMEEQLRILATTPAEHAAILAGATPDAERMRRLSYAVRLMQRMADNRPALGW